MQINYDPQADAIYIQLLKGEVDDTLQAGKYIYVDVDRDGDLHFTRHLSLRSIPWDLSRR